MLKVLSLFKFNKKITNSRLAILMLFFINVPFLLQGVNRPLFNIEEADKLFYLLKFTNPIQFLPGFHDAADFYGHPGLHQFILYIGTFLFGADLTIIRIINISICMGTILAVYFLVRTVFESDVVAFLTALILGLSPSFLYYSPLAMQDIMALGLLCLGLNFYFKGRQWVSVLALSMSVLALESSVAGVIGILCYEVLAERGGVSRKFKKIISLKLYFFPIVILCLFFLMEWALSGRISNSIIGHKFSAGMIGGEYFFNLKRVLDGFDSLYFYFVSNFSNILLFGGFFIFVIAYFFNNNKGFYRRSLLLGIVAIQYLLFYIFINEYPHERDFFFVGFLSVALFLSYLRNLPIKIILVPLASSLLLGFGVTQTFYEKSSEFSYYNRWRETSIVIENIARKISDKKDEVILPKNISQKLFAYRLFGVTEVDHQVSSDPKLVNTVVLFLPNHYPPYQNKKLLNDSFRLVLSTPKLIHGEFERAELYFRK